MRKTSLRGDRGSDEIELNMSPLIDMIFILLIFFLVTTSFVKESGVEVNRPAADSGKQNESTNMTIGVTKEGIVYIDNRQIDVLSVRSTMERFKHENPEGNVVITADKDSRFGKAIEVLDQVRLAGIKNVIMATETQ